MHKHLLLLAGLAGLASTTAHAQTERGTTLIGLSAGNLSYGRAADGSFRQFKTTVTPTAGRFVADNLLVGLGVQVGYARSQSEFAGYYYNPSIPLAGYGPLTFTHRSWSVGVTPFARYYFLGRGRHRLFAEAGVGVQRNWERERYQTETGRLTGQRQFTSFSSRVALGYNYFITPHTALEASAGYLRTYAPGGSFGKLDARVGINFLLPASKH